MNEDFFVVDRIDCDAMTRRTLVVNTHAFENEKARRKVREQRAPRMGETMCGEGNRSNSSFHGGARLNKDLWES